MSRIQRSSPGLHLAVDLGDNSSPFLLHERRKHECRNQTANSLNSMKYTALRFSTLKCSYMEVYIQVVSFRNRTQSALLRTLKYPRSPFVLRHGSDLRLSNFSRYAASRRYILSPNHRVNRAVCRLLVKACLSNERLIRRGAFTEEELREGLGAVAVEAQSVRSWNSWSCRMTCGVVCCACLRSASSARRSGGRLLRR